MSLVYWITPHKVQDLIFFTELYQMFILPCSSVKSYGRKFVVIGLTSPCPHSYLPALIHLSPPHTQIIRLLNSNNHKWLWLTQRLVEFMSEGSILVFVTKKANAEELCNNLQIKEFDALLLHGDMSQYERNEVITAFKRKDKPILVATDVAARGLDIPHIRTVVNYDVARDIDTHTHRIGRTGECSGRGIFVCGC